MRSEGKWRRGEIHARACASVYDIDRFALGAALAEAKPAAAEKLSALMQPDKAVQRPVIGVGGIHRFPQDGPVRDNAGFDFAMGPKCALTVFVEGDGPPLPSEFTPFPLGIEDIGDLAAHITMFHAADASFDR